MAEAMSAVKKIAEEPTDAELSKLFGFDIKRARGILMQAYEQQSSDRRREGCMNALLLVDELGAELVEKARWQDAARMALPELSTIARGFRDVAERQLEDVARARSLAAELAAVLHSLEGKVLPGSPSPSPDRGRGAPTRNMLAGIESVLSHHGFSHREIGELDLDGQRRVGESNGSRESPSTARVRQRLRALAQRPESEQETRIVEALEALAGLPRKEFGE